MIFDRRCGVLRQLLATLATRQPGTTRFQRWPMDADVAKEPCSTAGTVAPAAFAGATAAARGNWQCRMQERARDGNCRSMDSDPLPLVAERCEEVYDLSG
jgi:hypothetical protein